MTDKEQIIIDTNKYFVEIIDEGGGTIGYTVVFPGDLLKDIIKQNKQLARKTQECEELKLKCLGNRNDYLCERQVTKRYLKALKEIEKCIKINNCEGINCSVCELNNDCIAQDILSLINKAKGE